MRAKLPQASTGIWFLVGVVSTLVATRMLSGTPTADDVDTASEVLFARRRRRCQRPGRCRRR
jgi:hypothetical protein